MTLLLIAIGMKAANIGHLEAQIRAKEHIEPMFERNLVVSFDTHLILAFDEFYGHALSNIFQKRGNKLFKISSIRDLEGHVSIRSADQALQYVRLLTSPATGSSFIVRETACEITAREELNESMGFGSRSVLAFIGDFPDGWYGVVRKKWMAKHKVEPAKVISTAHGWAISRTCLVFAKRFHAEPRIYVWNETVERDGKYMRSIRETFLPKRGAIHWVYKAMVTR